MWGNYRGLALSSCTAKVFNRLLLNRLTSQTESLLRCNQNAYRKQRSTIHSILAFRRIMEEEEARQTSACAAQLDFSKAFDSVFHTSVERVLEEWRVPMTLRKAIMAGYDGYSVRVMTPVGLTDAIVISRGVLQGDSLSPYIFLLIVDSLMSRVVTDDYRELGIEIRPRVGSRSRGTDAVYLTDTEFADDVTYYAKDPHSLQTLVSRIW